MCGYKYHVCSVTCHQVLSVLEVAAPLLLGQCMSALIVVLPGNQPGTNGSLWHLVYPYAQRPVRWVPERTYGTAAGGGARRRIARRANYRRCAVWFGILLRATAYSSIWLARYSVRTKLCAHRYPGRGPWYCCVKKARTVPSLFLCTCTRVVYWAGALVHSA